MVARQQRRKHVPQRTCVVCRRKTDKRRLTRIVCTADRQLIVDETGKRAGRGAYLCDRDACWEEATRGTVLKKALKADVSREDLALLAAQRPVTKNETAL